jgi:hypothetical protein
VTPSTSPSAESTGSLTPLGSLAFPLVPITTPSQIPPRGDPDYVWDVFYHRLGLLNDRDGAANVATLYVKPAVFYEMSEMTIGTAGQVFPSL